MALTKCTVSGTLKDATDTAIVGSVVITPSNFGKTVSGNNQIDIDEVTVDCNSAGEWTVDLIQSAMFSSPVVYQFEFRDADGNFLFRQSGLTIPAEATKDFNDLT